MGLSIIGALSLRVAFAFGIVGAQAADSIGFGLSADWLVIFVISGIAENIARLSICDAESELVAGFHTEYSACAGRSFLGGVCGDVGRTAVRPHSISAAGTSRLSIV